MLGTRMYRALDAEKVVATIAKLELRIEERFPGSGLSKVCNDLLTLGEQTSTRITDVARPHWGLRATIVTVAGLGLLTLVALFGEFLALKGSDQLSEVMQGIDAAMNLTIVVGGAAFFVSTLEARWKRRRAQMALHEIRSIIHVIDMHQLTKDPGNLGQAQTASSPERNLTPFELMRYLDYCSEMLSLAAKLAALYAEKLVDPAIVDTVGDIERLTSHLSNKIWQKITLTQTIVDSAKPDPAAPTAKA
jgi:hypothetical protein